MTYAAWNRSGRLRTLRLPGWQIALLLVAALAIGIAVAIVATGVFLIVLPIALAAALAYRLFGARRRGRRPDGGVIEGDYEVIERSPPGEPHDEGRPR